MLLEFSPFTSLYLGSIGIEHVIRQVNHAIKAWVKVQNFKNPELLKIRNLKLAVCLQNIKNSKLNGQIP